MLLVRFWDISICFSGASVSRCCPDNISKRSLFMSWWDKKIILFSEFSVFDASLLMLQSSTLGGKTGGKGVVWCLYLSCILLFPNTSWLWTNSICFGWFLCHSLRVESWLKRAHKYWWACPMRSRLNLPHKDVSNFFTSSSSVPQYNMLST